MNAMDKFSYGLFVLTAKDGQKDNGCIINTAIQATVNPDQVLICLNKVNYTCDMIKKTGQFNLSFLTEEAGFDIFQRFGFQCGKDIDKFRDFEKYVHRADNGIFYLTKATNAMVSVQVENTADLGSHMMFAGSVKEQKDISQAKSLTYQYYFDHVKPAPETGAKKKKGFVCKICGYVYEGDTLPPDFICPLCKHGAEDFEPIG